VILVPGPLHLFWTSGIYYLYELAKVYKVVLIVSHEYLESAAFNEVLGNLDVAEIIYVPKKNIINRHRYYSHEFHKLILQYRPVFIFHHDIVQVTLMYLFYFARQHLQDCRLVSFATTMTMLNWRHDFDRVVQVAIDELKAKSRLPYALARRRYVIESWIKYALDYYILPLLFLRVFFRPGMNVYLRKRMRKQWNDQFDHFLLYDELDLHARQEICGSDKGLVRIQHPLTTSGKEINEKRYPFPEKDIVLILPSSVLVNQYKNEISTHDEVAIRMFADGWLKAVEILRKKFPGFEIVWKSHPSDGQNALWVRVVNRLKERCPELMFLDPKASAQNWILQSKVVVGDVSSSLWWASMLETKVVFSLDIFGIRNVDELKHRRGIYYIDNLEKLFRTDINIRQCEQSTIGKNFPTLLEFTSDIEARV